MLGLEVGRRSIMIKAILKMEDGRKFVRVVKTGISAAIFKKDEFNVPLTDGSSLVTYMDDVGRKTSFLEKNGCAELVRSWVINCK